MPDTPTPETLRALVERLRQHAREYRLDAQGDGTQLGHERKRMLAEGYDRSADELAALLDTAPGGWLLRGFLNRLWHSS